MIKLYRYEIKQPSDKPRALAAQQRAAAKMLVEVAAKELCGAENPTVRKGAHGKPYFRDLPIKFSVSHCKSRVVVAVSEREIGVDIQHISPRRADITKRFFTEEEAEYVGSDTARFYEIWTKKEAYSKWKGTPLAENLGICVLDLVFYTENDGEYFLSVYEK